MSVPQLGRAGPFDREEHSFFLSHVGPSGLRSVREERYSSFRNRTDRPARLAAGPQRACAACARREDGVGLRCNRQGTWRQETRTARRELRTVGRVTGGRVGAGRPPGGRAGPFDRKEHSFFPSHFSPSGLRSFREERYRSCSKVSTVSTSCFAASGAPCPRFHFSVA